jgi:MOSC domain-containing protein YiiM
MMMAQSDIKHRSHAELEAAFRALPPAPKDSGRLVLIVTRPQQGGRETPETVRLTPEEGVPGDKWSWGSPRKPDMQIAVMRADVAALIANGQPLTLFGDALFVDLDISAPNLPTGTRLRVGDAVLEVTPQAHNGCSKFRAKFGAGALQFVAAKLTRDQNFRGIYWKVVEAGNARVGSPIEVIHRPAVLL